MRVRSAEQLRALASTRLADQDRERAPAPLELEAGQLGGLLHELRIHQVELELQNEELRRGQAELEERTRRYRQLFEDSPVGYLVVDETGLTLQVNAAAAELLGEPRAAVVETSLPARVAPGDRDALHRALRAARTSGHKVRCEVGLADRDQAVVLIDCAPLPAAEGERPQLQLALLDLSEQRALERRLERARRLEELGQLAGEVAHDFNNSLAVILSSCSLASEELGSESPAHRALGAIRESALRARRLTQDVLAFGRRQALHPVALDLAAQVRESLEALGPALGPAIHLEVQAGADPVHVLADPHQVHRVIANLALNARDAMPEGGTLSLEVGTWERPSPGGPDDLAPGTYGRLRVRDQGPGLSKVARARLFEPFFTTKPPGQGTGLGLACVHGILRQHGGAIEAACAPGEGACFEVFLPACPPPAAEDAPRPEDAPDPGEAPPAVVLLVEDEALVRDVTTRLLEVRGFEVLGSASGAEALALLEEEGDRIDLLYSDVTLPDLDGLQLSRRARALRPDLPVLLTSGYAESWIGELAPLGGATAYLQKPSPVGELIATLRDLLRESQGASQAPENP